MKTETKDFQEAEKLSRYIDALEEKLEGLDSIRTVKSVTVKYAVNGRNRELNIYDSINIDSSIIGMKRELRSLIKNNKDKLFLL